MRPIQYALSAIVAAGLTVPFVAAGVGGDDPVGGSVEEYDAFDVFIEINGTDGDAGFQGMIDGGPWRRTRLVSPAGKTLCYLRPQHEVYDQGLTELFWESSEPPFTAFSLPAFLQRFPEGEYMALGKSILGDFLMSTDDLTHDLPATPNITSHMDGDEVEFDGENLVITWDPVVDDYQGGPLASQIVLYKLTCEWEEEINGEDLLRVFTVDVLPHKTSAEVPADFLPIGEELKIELGANEESNNTTFVELSICIVDDV